MKVLAMDVDGTLTDGKINIAENGELFKAFNVQDGYGIAQELKREGITPVIITARESKIVEERCKELGIEKLYQHIENKLEKLKEICAEMNVSLEEVAYIGDDVPDLECVLNCGVSGCPANSHISVKQNVDYVCDKAGGDGAVREFIDWLIYTEAANEK